MTKMPRDAAHLRQMQTDLERVVTTLREVAADMEAQQISVVPLETEKAMRYVQYLANEWSPLLPGRYQREKIRILAHRNAEADALELKGGGKKPTPKKPPKKQR